MFKLFSLKDLIQHIIGIFERRASVKLPLEHSRTSDQGVNRFLSSNWCVHAVHDKYHLSIWRNLRLTISGPPWFLVKMQVFLIDKEFLNNWLNSRNLSMNLVSSIEFNDEYYQWILCHHSSWFLWRPGPLAAPAPTFLKFTVLNFKHVRRRVLMHHATYNLPVEHPSAQHIEASGHNI